MNNTHSISHGTVSLATPRHWALASFFVASTVFFTQLFLLITPGLLAWIPFLFMTVFVAYRYGWKMGLVTAIASPAINYVLFNEPGANEVSWVMFTGSVAAGIASFAAYYRNRN